MASKRLAVVTGGMGGLGETISTKMADAGYRVAVTYSPSNTKYKAWLEEMKGRGYSFAAFPVDVVDYDDCAKACERIQKECGPIDILVNNAGWDRVRGFLDTEPALWDQLIAINLRGPLNMHHVVVRAMAARGQGRVVNIASDAGRVGSSGEAVYAACKGGIIAFTKSLARELAQAGVTLNAVCPGPTDTPLLRSFLDEGEQGRRVYEGLKRAIPLRRLGLPEDVAGIVAFLASDEASYITGQVISVSGGLTMHG
jgi:2-hydroxycyclohexanecarboxyl-CoA dehydrogenase